MKTFALIFLQVVIFVRTFATNTRNCTGLCEACLVNKTDTCLSCKNRTVVNRTLYLWNATCLDCGPQCKSGKEDCSNDIGCINCESGYLSQESATGRICVSYNDLGLGPMAKLLLWIILPLALIFVIILMVGCACSQGQSSNDLYNSMIAEK